MNTIFLISVYSLLLIFLFTFIFLRAREEIISLRKKYLGIVGITPAGKAAFQKNGMKVEYDRTIRDRLNEKKKEKDYISESIAA